MTNNHRVNHYDCKQCKQRINRKPNITSLAYQDWPEADKSARLLFKIIQWHLLLHDENDLPWFVERILQSDDTRMMKSIHDVNLTFKLVLLAWPRFDELGAEPRGSVQLHTLFNDAKSTSELLVNGSKKRALVW